MNNYILYINVNDQVIEYPLPSENNRTFDLDIGSSAGIYGLILKFEVFDGIWRVFSDEAITLEFSDRPNAAYWNIGDGDVFTGVIKKSGIDFKVIVRKADEDLVNFKKYYISDMSRITIGTDENCNIHLKNKFASRHHADIYRKGNAWYYNDLSTNGSYVNGSKVEGEIPLNVFDCIHIIDMKIVFLGDVIAMNQSNYVDCDFPLVALSSGCLAEDEESEDPDFFSRSPRLLEPFDTEPVEIEGPPAPRKERRNPLLFILGPALTMPLPILASVIFNVYRYSHMSYGSSMGPWMYFGMLIAVVLSAGLGAFWAYFRNRYSEKVEKEEEELRVSSYRKYILRNEEYLEQKHQFNKGILNDKYYDCLNLMDVLDTERMWNRNYNHEDFLSIRLGVGRVPFQAQIKIPKERFSVIDDDLAEEPRRLYERFKHLNGAVSTISLRERNIIGIIGNQNNVYDITKNILIQLSYLHCYTDVHIAFLGNKEDEAYFHWVKWLPHVFTSDRKSRLIGFDSLSHQNVLYQLGLILRNREEAYTESNNRVSWPSRYFVVCTDPQIIMDESLSKYITNEADYGVTFLLAYGEMDRLPKECTSIIEISDKFSGYYHLDGVRDETNAIQFDTLSYKDAEIAARNISGKYVSETGGGAIPGSVDFLEMYQIGRMEHWDLLKCWKKNRTYESMRAMIGIGTGNKPIYLDIHEKQFGPHGLIAGTTGSGKSETIQTYILSLIMNYHPDEISLILIDYKGGGMAQAFEGLPHLAGTITNLGGNETRRALVSIKSEIKHRQAMFSRYKVNHIDTYARLYREGKAEEALPHLIIISDEFAELKKEHPEFIKELVSAARVGRSLGVHLILATQKPSGVVDGEIWSNSRFKICLRVQDRQDSNEMLKCPDAAFLTHTGRAYLQIGNNELFEEFQSGYSGAEYIPHDESTVAGANEVTMIQLDGSNAVVHGKKVRSGENSISQLEAGVNYIVDTAKANHIRWTRKLWLEELPKVISLAEVEEKYPQTKTDGLHAVFGIFDYPEKQIQNAATIDFMDINNLAVIGVSGCGTSTLVYTILHSLITSYTSREVQCYCLDFSGGQMRVFESAPHCGGVVYSDDSEKVHRLFQMMEDAMAFRKKRFAEENVGSLNEYQRQKKDIPSIIIALDNYYSFADAYVDLEDRFEKLAREGSKYGIHLIVSMNSMNDMRYKFRQLFTSIIPLQLTERTDYHEALGVTPGFLPGSVKGRGLLMDEAVMEFQTALPVGCPTEQERFTAMDEIYRDLAKATPAKDFARQIPYIPLEDTYDQYLGSERVRLFTEENSHILPMGYHMDDISLYGVDLHKVFCYGISSCSVKSIFHTFNCFCRGAKQVQGDVYVVNLEPAHQKKLNLSLCDKLITNKEEMEALLRELAEENNKRKEFIDSVTEKDPEADVMAALDDNFRRIFVMIDDMSLFLDMVYDVSNAGFVNVVEGLFKRGAGRNIFFVAGFRAPSAYSGNYYFKACKQFVSYGHGIELGGQFNQQPYFTFDSSMSGYLTKSTKYNIGALLDGEKYREIYLPVMEEE